MDELLDELEKTNADLAKKLRTAHTSALDEQKGLVSAAEKKAKAAEKLAEKLKGDADASGKTVEEQTAAARKERDDARAEAKKAADDLQAHRVTVALERKLGIADETKARRAVAALREHAPDGFELDAQGRLVGADKAIEAFKTAEPFWFGATEPAAPTTPRAGSAPSPAKPAGSSGAKSAPATRAEKIAAHKAKMSGDATNKKGE